MHHYQHHIGDYEAATSHLTWEEDMAYTRLMRVYYRDEKLRALSLDEVFRLVRAKTKTQKKAVETVLAEFFIKTADGWQNKRVEKEIRKFQDKSLKAQSSANARWGHDANAMPTHKPDDANAMLTDNRKPITDNQEPVNTPPTPASGDGDEPPALPEVVLAWNEIPGVVHVRDMTPGRKKSLRARMADPTWTAHWAEGLQRVAASKFCRGQGEGGWRANFDWFVRPDTLTKILEGVYDDRRTSNPGNRSGHGGGANMLQREQDREAQQLGILRDFVQGHDDIDRGPASGFRPVHGLPDGDEANG